MPTAEKDALYRTRDGKIIKIINFASHAITNEVFVIFSSYNQGRINKDNIKILSLEKFTKSSCKKVET